MLRRSSRRRSRRSSSKSNSGGNKSGSGSRSSARLEAGGKVTDRPLQVLSHEGFADGHSSVSGLTESAEQKHQRPDRLCFDPSRLYGRSAELRVLHESIERNADFILVHGPSGSGKSKMVESLRSHIVEDNDGFFVSAKFDQLRSNEPLAAVVSCFSDIIDLLCQTENASDRGSIIGESLDSSDLHGLSKVLPTLFFLCGNSRTSPYEGPLNDFYRTPARFHVLAQSFWKALSKSSPNQKILVFWDDVQWADDGSMEVMRALLSSPQPNITVVIAYRNNELCLEDRESFRKQRPVEIEVGSLPEESINEMVVEMTGLAPEETHELASVALAKTGGNAFHIVQFFMQLEDLSLMTYTSNRWTWDLLRIQAETSVSQNIVDLVSAKLERLPNEVSTVLVVAAFLGYQFDMEFLHQVFVAIVSENARFAEGEAAQLLQSYPALRGFQPAAVRELLQHTLRKASEWSLIETCGFLRMKFSHDRVQQSCYNMIRDETERSKLHLWIGRAIQDMVTGNRDQEALLFSATDQLNRGRTVMDTKGEEGVQLAVLNLRVGKIAGEKSAYKSAAQYLEVATSLCGGRWSSHYRLTLDVFSTSAEMEHFSGHLLECEKSIRAVLQNARCTDDKLRVWQTQIANLGAQEKLKEAITCGLAILRRLGVRLPRRPTMLHVVLELTRTKKQMKMTDEEILDLPIMRNPRHKCMMKVIACVATYLYFAESVGAQFAMVVLKMVDITCRHGLADMSSFAFSCYGMLHTNTGNYDEGMRFGQLALCSLERLNFSIEESRTLVCIGHFVLPWRAPLLTCLEPFLRSYYSGIKVGEIEFAFFGANGVLLLLLFAGSSLQEANEYGRKFYTEMRDLNVVSAFRMTVPYWQVVLNLMGEEGSSGNNIKLTGEGMNEEEMVQRATAQKNFVALQIINCSRLLVATIFDDVDEAKKICSLVRRGAKYLNAHIWNVNSQFYMGLTYIQAARRSNCWMLLRKAKAIKRRMQKWTEDGVVNCEAPHLILKAELASLSGNLTLYKDAINKCESSLQFEALAHEKAAQGHLHNHDIRTARLFMLRATQLYNSWGAFAKVDQLQSRYGELLNEPMRLPTYEEIPVSATPEVLPLIHNNEERYV